VVKLQAFETCRVLQGRCLVVQMCRLRTRRWCANFRGRHWPPFPKAVRKAGIACFVVFATLPSIMQLMTKDLMRTVQTYWHWQDELLTQTRLRCDSWPDAGWSHVRPLLFSGRSSLRYGPIAWTVGRNVQIRTPSVDLTCNLTQASIKQPEVGGPWEYRLLVVL